VDREEIHGGPADIEPGSPLRTSHQVVHYAVSLSMDASSRRRRHGLRSWDCAHAHSPGYHAKARAMSDLWRRGRFSFFGTKTSPPVSGWHYEDGAAERSGCCDRSMTTLTTSAQGSCGAGRLVALDTHTADNSTRRDWPAQQSAWPTPAAERVKWYRGGVHRSPGDSRPVRSRDLERHLPHQPVVVEARRTS